MQILLANPRGFCAGVDRAISIVRRALDIYGPPIYVRHEVVHNSYVVNSLRKCGVTFVENLNEVPNDAILIFSAHGVSQSVRDEAKSRNLTMLLDATCPLVTKVHMEVARASRSGIETILIGHAGHPEVEGTMGQYNNSDGGIYLVESMNDVTNLKVKDDSNLYLVTQTTLSVDDTTELIQALRKRFPAIKSPRKEDICYATSNRQAAVRKIAQDADLILVVGSSNSSNSNRLAEQARRAGREAKLIGAADEIKLDWLKEVRCVGITAGASAPEILVQQVVQRLSDLGCNEVSEVTVCEEKVTFDIPQELRINTSKIN